MDDEKTTRARLNDKDDRSSDAMSPGVRAMFEATPFVSGGRDGAEPAPAPAADAAPGARAGVPAPPESPTPAVAGGPPDAILPSTIFEFNGKRYTRFEEMPPEIRAIFAAAETGAQLSVTTTDASTVLYRVGDKTYPSLDAMPADLRATIERSLPAGALPGRAPQTRYRVGDTEYASLEEVPARFRAFFRDEYKDGILDVLERGPGAASGARHVVIDTDLDEAPGGTARGAAGERPSVRDGTGGCPDRRGLDPVPAREGGITIRIGPGAVRLVKAVLVLGALLAIALVVRWLKR